MADVRSLLRQQRAARRIEHPHAAYTDAGKLLCTLCRELVKAESLWDGHLQGDSHQRRAASAATLKSQNVTRDGEEGRSVTVGSNQTLPKQQKRKLDADEADEDSDTVDGTRGKRSRPDTVTDSSGNADRDPNSLLTPPPPASLPRKMSAMLSQGVEVKIPSRPATPAAPRDVTPSSSISGTAPSAMSPQRQQQAAGLTGSRPRKASTLSTSAVDESEWAAFEADVAADAAPYAEDAVISAPAMTAEESAAAAAAASTVDENGESRKAKADKDIEDEREEAARALEEEFEEMRELEERVKRLKEKREALRKRAESRGEESGPERPLVASTGNGKDGDSAAVSVNAGTELADEGGQAEADGEDDDDTEDDEDADWNGFLFRPS
ncbi:coiled-coil domain-containing protein 16 [Drechmeria coniospora]|uniref:Coiled-coil domain-containing protein 16 n=1 Tax=Drechmeria coniospora TaxID=98403 RepID=A0A151GVJ5_DRECN|nr:coiled-coil domain-containing protein 16 [Drechmeria coniospora]KYK61137.1 coiled-coil domain-containing protein 16 [Drechmeria coniospora]ODA80904.1 hypothetical protein RJ55_03864 [Drechmeria coniospora]